MPPLIAPDGGLPRLIALYSATWQFGLIVGPATSGLPLRRRSRRAVLVAGGCFAAGAAAIAMTAVRCAGRSSARRPTSGPTLHHAVEGLRFIRRRPILLGAISLDLFAVLFGGAVALLPAIAEDRLGVGNVGYGWLRAAPGIGAVIVSSAAGRATRSPPRRPDAVRRRRRVRRGDDRARRHRRSFAVAFVALVVLAGADSVSVFIRATIVPLATPTTCAGGCWPSRTCSSARRTSSGRSSAASPAALLGVGPAVVLGGVATMAVVGLWARWFPELRAHRHVRRCHRGGTRRIERCAGCGSDAAGTRTAIVSGR